VAHRFMPGRWCTTTDVKKLARLVATTTLVTAGLGLADLTIATAAQAQVGAYATHGHGDPKGG